VYAVEIRLNNLDYIRNLAVKAGLGNVVPVLVRKDDFYFLKTESICFP